MVLLINQYWLYMSVEKLVEILKAPENYFIDLFFQNGFPWNL